jgi:hypothetical protein
MPSFGEPQSGQQSLVEALRPFIGFWVACAITKCSWSLQIPRTWCYGWPSMASTPSRCSR